jgi:hypothetical protein
VKVTFRTYQGLVGEFAKGIDKEIINQLIEENYLNNHKYLLLSM